MRDRARRRLRGLLLIPLSLLLTGCWDLTRLEDLAIIGSIGLDTAPRQELKVSVAVTNPASASQTGGKSGGASPSAAPSLIYTVKGSTVNDAMQKLDLFTSRRPTVIQVRILLVGEDKAKKGLISDMDVFTRFRGFRRTLRMFVVEGSAAKLLRSIEPDLEITPTNVLAGMGAKRTTARIPIPDNRIHDFLLSTESKGREAVLPLLRMTGRSGSEQSALGGQSGGGGGGGMQRGGGQGGGGAGQGGGGPGQGGKKRGLPQIVGLAVFRGGRMVGKMGVDELIPYALLTQETPDAYVTVEGKGGADGRWRVTAVLTSKKGPGVKVKRRPERDLIKVKVTVDGPVVEVRGGETFSPGWLLAEVEPRLKKKLTRDMRRLVQHAQEEWRSDIFGFGKRARNTFSTWAKWKDYPWNERFTQAEVKIDVELNLQTVGRSTRPPGNE